MELRTIGTVRSTVSDPDNMPFEGVPAQVELHPQYQDGLLGIDEGTHVIVIAWLHQAGRESLQISRTRRASGRPRGVFGLRSSHRPNPLGLTTSRLLRVDGPALHLERLDFVDGTPVVDLKRYSPSWDSIFSARSSRDMSYPPKGERRPLLDGMLVEAVNFHGERCVGTALGVRILLHAMERWEMAQKDPKLVLHMADDGCIADALQGLSGATLGNGRMKVPHGRAFRLSYDDKKVMAFQPRELPAGTGVEQVLEADIDELFAIREDVYAGGSGPHGGRPPKRLPAPEKRAMLLELVEQSVEDGRLSCGKAHRLAEGLGVSLPDVGWAADEAKVRIVKCQLGCFR
jgi:tRNA (adenine37-N6)-methyltransferase